MELLALLMAQLVQALFLNQLHQRVVALVPVKAVARRAVAADQGAAVETAVAVAPGHQDKEVTVVPPALLVVVAVASRQWVEQAAAIMVALVALVRLR